MALTLLRFAWRQIARRPRRAALVASTVAAGLFVLVFLRALQDGYVAERLEQLTSGHVQVRAPEGGVLDPARTEELLAALAARPGVLAAAPRLRATGWLQAGGRGTGAELLGVDDEREVAAGWLRDRAPRTPAAGAGTPGVYLARDLAARLGVGVGDRLAFVVPDRDGVLVADRAEVLDLLDEGGWRGRALLRRDDLAARLGVPGAADGIAVRLAEPLRAGALADALARDLELPVQGWQQTAPELLAAVETLSAMERLRHLVLFALVGLGIHATIAMSVAERRRELAVLQAVGMSPRALVGALLIESGLLAAAGLLVGLAAAWVVVVPWLGPSGLDLASLGARLPVAFAEQTVLHPRLDGFNVALATAWAGAVALLVPLPSARRVLRLDPAEALRARE